MKKIGISIRLGATIAITMMISLEIWITSRRVYFLFDQENYIGGQSVLMHVVFRYVGAIIGSCIAVGALHLANREMHATEYRESNKKSWEEDAKESSSLNENVAEDDVKKSSRVLVAIFTGIAGAFFMSRFIY